MKDFKFLKRNTWYNPDQQAYTVCGSTINHTAINVNNIMAEAISASNELQERIAQLEYETRFLRDMVNQQLIGSSEV